MYDRAYALATGAFIVLALAALFLTAYWLTGMDTERRPYVVVSAYSVAGLGEGSQVLYRGVPAGRVEQIRIDPADPSRVLIRINVDPQIPVHYSTFARLHMRGLTGVAQVELHDTGARPQPLPTAREAPATIQMQPSLVDSVTDAGTQALTTLNALADSLQSLLDQENVDNLSSALARVDRTMAAVEQAALVLEAELPRTLDGATRTVNAVGVFVERATHSMDDVDALVAELRATAVMAQQLGQDLSDRTTPGLQSALAALDRAAQEVGRLAQTLARQPERLLRGSRAEPGPGE